jgi:predicted kinase
VLVQLSGVPGAGKSTLARAIAESTGFVVVDTDVLKSSLITSGVSLAAAGSATYAAALALAQDLLDQGRSVVLDSPCRYRQLLDVGSRIASEVGVRYAFIELWTQDWSVVVARLNGLAARVSQVASGRAPRHATRGSAIACSHGVERSRRGAIRATSRPTETRQLGGTGWDRQR